MVIRRFVYFLACAVALAEPAKANAQVCHGSLPFQAGRRLSISSGFSSLHGPTLNAGHVDFLSVNFGVGEYFGRTRIAENVYSDYGYSSREVDLAAGEAIALSSQSKLVLCPEIELWLERAGSLGTATSLTSRSITSVASLRIGSLHRVGRMPMLGFVGGGFYRSNEELASPGIPGLGPDKEVSTSLGGFGEVGVGMNMLRLMDAVISYQVPIGVKQGFRTATVVIGISF